MPKHQFNWTEKTAVITGGGSGIGRAVAIALVKKGAIVHLVDCHQARIAAVLDELSSTPSICVDEAPLKEALNLHGHTVNVTKPEQLEQLASALQSKVDILINCAGILHQGKIATTANTELHQVLDVNLWGVIHSIKAFLPQMRNRENSSHIINIASIAGLIGAPEMAIYNASKSAILSLTESLSIELAADNIHVAAVCPGSIKTNLGQDGMFSSESTVAQTLRKTIHNGAKPERVASDIIQTIEQSSMLKLSCVEWHWQFLWMCKRLFPSLYPKFASFVYHQVIEKGFLDGFLSQNTKARQWL